jgi:hypothetical protein
MKRRAFITFLGSAAAWPLAARAQRADRKRRIGVLLVSNAEAESLRREIREGLRKAGYAEWQNIDFERCDRRREGSICSPALPWSWWLSRLTLNNEFFV